VERDKTFSWFTDDFMPRMNKDSALLVICTRWHIDDLVGRLMKKFPEVRYGPIGGPELIVLSGTPSMRPTRTGRAASSAGGHTSILITRCSGAARAPCFGPVVLRRLGECARSSRRSTTRWGRL
jgi:hypothetical protein